MSHEQIEQQLKKLYDRWSECYQAHLDRGGRRNEEEEKDAFAINGAIEYINYLKRTIDRLHKNAKTSVCVQRAIWKKKVKQARQETLKEVSQSGTQQDQSEKTVCGDTKPINELIWGAIKEAHKNAIQANAILLNKNLAITKAFAFTNGSGRYLYARPMILGLKAVITEELPEEYAFAVAEVDEEKLLTQYEKDVRRLKELENKLESGHLVALPCKVGDTVYGVGFYDCEQGHTDDEKLKREIFKVCVTMDGRCDNCKYSHPTIEQFVCTQIQIANDGILVVGEKCENYYVGNVFTDKSQAEARLKELQDKKQNLRGRT